MQFPGHSMNSLLAPTHRNNSTNSLSKCVTDEFRVLAGNAHPTLAASVSRELLVPEDQGVVVGKFANGETSVIVKESVRDLDVFVCQPTCGPNVNDNLMELLIIADAARRASAKRITAVVPMYGYSRQDKKDASRAPITAKLVANLLMASGIDRLMTLDLHASQIQGFFDIPVDNLYAEPLFKRYLESAEVDKQDLARACIVSPDAGGVRRAKSLADKLNCPLAIIHKERREANKVASMTLIGDVRDRIVFILDDMADTCGTLCLAAKSLIDNGAIKVHALITHGILSGPACQRLVDSPIESIVVTNSVPVREKIAECPKIKVLDIGPLIAEGIRRTHNGGQISSLFDATSDIDLPLIDSKSRRLI